MNILMLGIDHTCATIEERAVFSFTKKAASDFLLNFINRKDVLGCILISTCNRMELWVSMKEGYEDSPYEMLCDYKRVNPEKYRSIFKKRTGCKAVRHLFYLTSGMKSKIVGEDQVLTQVKEALDTSRNLECTDKMLEVLFRMAITAGKKIKTDYKLSFANKSIIHKVIHDLKESGYVFLNKKCMVIGNGEMGKLAASMLKDEGAQVLVTVRQYRSGVVVISEGCERINYGERLKYLPEQDLILSATASPNPTLKYEDVKEMQFTSPKVMIDLAVPRDIDKEIGYLDQVTLYDLDSFQMEVRTKETKEEMKKIEKVLEEKVGEFISWYECEDMIPVVHSISERAANDVQLRIEKTVRKLTIPGNDKELLDKTVEAATAKVVKKLMFGIRDQVSPATFGECIEAINKLYDNSSAMQK